MAAAATACRQPWGLTVCIQGDQRFCGSSILKWPASPSSSTSAAAAGAPAGDLLQQQQQQQSTGQQLEPWLQQAINNGLLDDLQAQPCCGCSESSPTDGALSSALADSADSADIAGTAAAAREALQLQVRQQWVRSRLLQAQGQLEEADAAGRACLWELERLGQLEAAAGAVRGASADNGSGVAGAGSTAAADDGGNARGRSGQKEVSLLLPSCHLDSTVDAAAVRDKLDTMWLCRQLLAAEQQLQGLPGVLLQVQQLSAALEQQQAEQQQAEQQQWELLECVHQVQAVADDILEVVGPRCLGNSGGWLVRLYSNPADAVSPVMDTTSKAMRNMHCLIRGGASTKVGRAVLLEMPPPAGGLLQQHSTSVIRGSNKLQILPGI